jgi:hypothetical protein
MDNEKLFFLWGLKMSTSLSLTFVCLFVCLFFILIDPCIVDYSVEIPTRCSFVVEFIIPKFF